jgi:uncharacterized protein
MFYAAFLIGLMGSLHCVGMCGPLTLMLAPKGSSSFRYYFGRVLYNSGRVFTYTLLGFTVGFFGESASFFISQKTLSLTLGFAITLYFLLPEKIKNKLANLKIANSYLTKVKGFFGSLFGSNKLLSQFSFGLVNGLLPCGLIYAALSGAFLMTNWYDAGLYMAAFGLGTIPLMLPVSLGFSSLRLFISKNFKNLIPATYLVVAVWLIWKGFGFDIKNLYTAPNEKPAVECKMQ